MELTPSPRSAALLKSQVERTQATAKLLSAPPAPFAEWAEEEWKDPAPVREAMSPERFLPQVKRIDVAAADAAKEQARRLWWKTKHETMFFYLHDPPHFH